MSKSKKQPSDLPGERTLDLLHHYTTLSKSLPALLAETRAEILPNQDQAVPTKLDEVVKTVLDQMQTILGELETAIASPPKSSSPTGNVPIPREYYTDTNEHELPEGHKAEMFNTLQEFAEMVIPFGRPPEEVAGEDRVKTQFKFVNGVVDLFIKQLVPPDVELEQAIAVVLDRVLKLYSLYDRAVSDYTIVNTRLVGTDLFVTVHDPSGREFEQAISITAKQIKATKPVTVDERKIVPSDLVSGPYV